MFNKKVSDIVIPIFVFLSLIGLADASYLTYDHYTGTSVVCNIFDDCNLVTTSEYSEIFGISVALFGALYYLSVLISALLFTILKQDTFKNRILKILYTISPLGFLASLWFVYLQLFVIKAICLYCMISATTSTLIFITGIFLFVHRSKPE